MLCRHGHGQCLLGMGKAQGGCSRGKGQAADQAGISSLCTVTHGSFHCLQKWTSVTMASAFRGWAEHVAEAAEGRAKVQGSLLRLLHRSLFSAFAAWREAAAVQVEQRTKVMTCLTRLTQRVSCTSTTCYQCGLVYG